MALPLGGRMAGLIRKGLWMDIETWLRLGIGLLQVIVWPLLALTAFLYFRKPLRKFIDEATVIRLEGAGGTSALVMERRVEAAISLTAAAYKQMGERTGEGLSSEQMQDITRSVDRVVTQRAIKRFADARILWVDDHPENNVYERLSFESLGIKVDVARATAEALEKVRAGRTFEVIISDMGRPDDREAGYTLLRALRKQGDKTPYVIYAGSDSPEYRVKAREEGALSSTNNPTELFELVVDAIKG